MLTSFILEKIKLQTSLDFRFKFEKLIATISTRFIHLTIDQIDDTMDEALKIIGEFCEVDRGYIFGIQTHWDDIWKEFMNGAQRGYHR